MKKILLTLMVLLMLTGCKTQTGIKLDAIVDIPLNPTEATVETTEPTTEPSTEPVEETTEPTEAPTEQKSTQKNNSTKKDTSKKKDTASKQEPTQLPTEAATEAPTQPPVTSYDPAGYSPSGRDRDVAAAVNAQRVAAGLGELTLDSRLCAIASVRAWEVSWRWGDTRPDGSAGITVLNEYGYGYSVAAENLYHGSAGGEGIVSRWMTSASRKANILMESATIIGVGSYTAPDGVTYVATLIVG